MMGKQTPPAVLWFCLAFLIAVSLFILLWFPHSVVDDAYIYARYAENLAFHGEMNWNVGEDPVEGYTGILLPLIYAAGFLAGIPLETSAAIIGLTCFTGTGLLLLLANRKHTWQISITTILLYSGMPFLYPHVFSGLETYPFIFFLVLTIFLFVKILKEKYSMYGLFALAALLLSISRPEGSLFAFSLVAAGLIAIYNYQPQSLRSYVIHALFIFILPFSSYWVWRWVYYGYPLPNSFYAKYTGGWITGSFHEVLSFFYANSFSLPILLLILLGCVLFLFYTVIQKGKDRVPCEYKKTYILLLGTLIPSLVILLVYAHSNMTMNFSYRYFTPFYLIILLLLGVFIDPIQQKIACFKRVHIISACLTLAIGFQPFLTTYFPDLQKEKIDAEIALEMIQVEHISIGKELASCMKKTETLVVIQDAGAIPYYSKLRTIDVGRLNDEYLAHNTPDAKMLNDHIFQDNPGVFVITSYSSSSIDRTLGGGDQRFIDQIIDDLRFNEYALAGIYSPGEPGIHYYEFVYIRDDLLFLCTSIRP